MAGQFGDRLAGGPGSIYRIDGQTGEVSLFADIPGNSGAGLGNLTFDVRSGQFFVSDFETGLIFRISRSGEIVENFDHGLSGRPNAGLSKINDDGSGIDLSDPGFDSEDPETWGLTPVKRRVWGLTAHGERLYYAVWHGPQIWSVGINEDGSFNSDARKEFSVDAAPESFPISDMVFDTQGRLILAQRGGLRGSFDYAMFAKAQGAGVLRYRRDEKGQWVTTPDDYAIGYLPDYRNAAGGIDLGYGANACDGTLWSTNNALKAGSDAAQAVFQPGLQGNDADLVRPQNVPPERAAQLKLRGAARTANAEGHAGDVEVWNPCNRPQGQTELGVPENFSAPGDPVPPTIIVKDPPRKRGFNLKLTKSADANTCKRGLIKWLCKYTIKVTNTGPQRFSGVIRVRDRLANAPATATVQFGPQPAPWTCAPSLPSTGTNFICRRDPVTLLPGQSVRLKASVRLPIGYPKRTGNCRVVNRAGLIWLGVRQDRNPADDKDSAVARIPHKECKQGEDDPATTNLRLTKQVLNCGTRLNKSFCKYLVTVTNTGVNAYSGTLKVRDILPVSGATTSFGTSWQCSGGQTTDCTRTVNLAGGTAIVLPVTLEVSNVVARQQNCTLTNRARILEAPGGSPANSDASDDMDTATGTIPNLCGEQPTEPEDDPDPDDPSNNKASNLRIEKQALDNQNCTASQKGNYDWCKIFGVRVINTGPSKFKGRVRFEDILPNGPTLVKVGQYGICNGATCRTDGPVEIAVGQSIQIKVAVRGSRGMATQLQCRLTNTVRLVKPQGGNQKNLLVTDDEASAATTLPEEFCGGDKPGLDYTPVDNPNDPDVGGLKTNLRLNKEFVSCENGSSQSRCRFRVTVTNIGSNPYNGTLKIRDSLQTVGATSSFGSGWSCSNAPTTNNIGPISDCSRQVNLAAGTAVTLPVTVTVPNEVARRDKCSLTNDARILEAPGGSSANSNSSDDRDRATGTIPLLCADRKPPEIETGLQFNLKVDKSVIGPSCIVSFPTTPGRDNYGIPNINPGDWLCGFKIKITNTGNNSFSGPVRIVDELVDYFFSRDSTVDYGWSVIADGWQCELDKVWSSNIVKCSTQSLSLAAGQSAEIVAIYVGFSDTILNSLHTPICYLHNRVGASFGGGDTNVSDNADTVGAKIPQRACKNAGQQQYRRSPPSDPTCPPGMRWTGERCYKPKDLPGDTVVDPKAPRCPTGWKAYRSRNAVPRNHKVTRRGLGHTVIWCAKPTDDPAGKCPKGTVGTPPNCDPVATQVPQCTGGRVKVGNSCVCKKPLTWNGRQCVKKPADQVKCTGGRVKHGNRCVCPAGKRWTGKICVRKQAVKKRCAAGYVGTFPNCRKLRQRKRNGR